MLGIKPVLSISETAGIGFARHIEDVHFPVTHVDASGKGPGDI